MDSQGNVRELNTVESCALMALSTKKHAGLPAAEPLLQGQQVMQEENIIPLDQRIREFEKNKLCIHWIYTDADGWKEKDDEEHWEFPCLLFIGAVGLLSLPL